MSAMIVVSDEGHLARAIEFLNDISDARQTCPWIRIRKNSVCSEMEQNGHSTLTGLLRHVTLHENFCGDVASVVDGNKSRENPTTRFVPGWIASAPHPDYSEGGMLFPKLRTRNRGQVQLPRCVSFSKSPNPNYHPVERRSRRLLLGAEPRQALHSTSPLHRCLFDSTR